MTVLRSQVLTALDSAATESFSRSGGPGGQNVNKVNTQVTIRVSLATLVQEIGETSVAVNQLVERLGSRVNEAGELVVQVSDTRSQRMNRTIARERAADLIVHALRPRRTRRPTSPSAAARQRRLEAKRHRSRIKQARGKVEE